MADEEELKLDADAATKKPSKIIIIIAAVAVVVLIAVAVALFFVLGSSDTEGEEGNEIVAEETAGPLQYYTLGPSFVVNFMTQTRQRYVKITIDVVTHNEAVIVALEHHEPMIRNEVLRIIGEKGFSNLRSIDNKLALQSELQQQLANILKQEASVEGLEAVLFTEFVMQ